MEGLPTPSPPKHYNNLYCVIIKETHQLLTVNTTSIKCDLDRGQNGYLGLILLPEQYAHVSGTAFVLPPDPGRTAQVPAWTLPTEEKRTLREHTE